MSTQTILHRLHENGRINPNTPAYFVKSGGHWVPTSWREYLREVRQAARAFIALGLQANDVVCMLGFNRPEWTIFAFGGMLMGGVEAGIYQTNSAEEVKYIVEHAEAKAILIEDEKQWAKIQKTRDQMPNLRHVVLMKGLQVNDPNALTWEQFMTKGDATPEAEIDKRLESLQMAQLATLIYTSGTTGPPKGVMLSHENLAETARHSVELLNLGSTDSVVSYLPLSHIAEQMFSMHAAVYASYQVYFAESGLKVADNIREVHPTLVFGVPRVWERFHAGVSARLKEAHGVRAKISDWARGIGTQVTHLKNKGQQPSGLLALQYSIANKLVFSKVKEALGLDRVHHCVSGAAPIAKEILEFFGSLDLIILEVYGQSEDTGPTSCNYPGATKFGSVGKRWPGTEVKIAEDGEILVKGPNVFMGYYKDEAATAETLQDGWLYSGDLGQFDEDGFLSIVGRKKEIIITSGGKNVAPKNIEAALKNIDLVSEAVIIGEKRRFLTALLTLEEGAVAKFAQANGIEGQELHTHPKLLAEIQKQINEKVNSQFARVEHVRDFRILPRNFSVETGELTPSLKIKRRIVDKNYAQEIESMYVEKEGSAE